MQYREDKKSGNQLSSLGFGCMRFPRTRGRYDLKQSEQIVLEAIQGGVNYFDTAYIYGGNEEAFGSILHNIKMRDKVYIATKLPIMRCQSYNDFDKLFQVQLERLKTNYIDYYLMHALSDMDTWKRLCDLGVEKWIQEKKLSGQIKQVGFSFHGTQQEFIKLLDAYDWDFCQIQYNYININYQAGRIGLQKAGEKGIPVIVMEPLLGGKLASGLPKQAESLFHKMNSSYSNAAWALRWLWNQKEVTVVLSGMSDSAQVKENIEISNSSRTNMLSEEELNVFHKVEEVFNEIYKIPCTGCNYCMPCPHNVNIPGCFAAYNLSYSMGKFTGFQSYMVSTGATNPKRSSSAGLCKECGKCEKHCPQHIAIPKSLGMVKKRMEPFWYKPLIRIVSKFM